MALVYNLVFFFLLEKMGEGPSNVVLSFFSRVSIGVPPFWLRAPTCTYLQLQTTTNTLTL